MNNPQSQSELGEAALSAHAGGEVVACCPAGARDEADGEGSGVSETSCTEQASDSYSDSASSVKAAAVDTAIVYLLADP